MKQKPTNEFQKHCQKRLLYGIWILLQIKMDTKRKIMVIKSERTFPRAFTAFTTFTKQTINDV
jgi:hypothetical protein